MYGDLKRPGANAGEFLEDDRGEEKISAPAAIRFRDVHAEEAGLAHAEPALAVGDPVPAPRFHLGSELGFREAPELAAKHLVFFAEYVTSHGDPSRARPALGAAGGIRSMI